MDKPLISFAVGCYNQEAFIKEAIEGALAQDYSPLEIIISDDCSKDRTFDIASQVASAYKGPHLVRLNCNSRNLGLAGNVNQALGMCRGELLVLAAGDDVSLPERTSVIFRAWNDSDRKATSLSSRYTLIDERGLPLSSPGEERHRPGQVRWFHEEGNIPNFLRRRQPHVAGCAHAISRKLMSTFGPLPETVTYEDTALCFRTLLVKGIFTFIDLPLLKYRRHGHNITFGLHQKRPRTLAAFEDFQRKRRCELERFVEVYKCFAADAQRALKDGLISGSDYPAVQKRIQAEGCRFRLRSELLVQPWLGRLRTFWELYCSSFRPREMLEHLPYLLPRDLYCAGVVARNRITGEMRPARSN